MTKELVRYDTMCRAIEAAYSIDEVKEIRNQAVALEHYAHQATNFEAERQCQEIRIRAEREVGKRLKEVPKAKGARGNPGGQGAKIVRSSGATTQKTLQEYGLTKDQSATWQRLADVPEEVFERELKAPGVVSAESIIFAHSPPPETPSFKGDARALWLWGRLQDFERDDLLGLDPKWLFDMMTDHMKETTRRLAPLVAAWLRRLPK